MSLGGRGRGKECKTRGGEKKGRNCAGRGAGGQRECSVGVEKRGFGWGYEERGRGGYKKRQAESSGGRTKGRNDRRYGGKKRRGKKK